MAPCADHEGPGSVDASTTVLVFGAGPSGLMLASNLVRFGIEVMILDDRPEKTSTGKADGMQPKKIETLRQMRLGDCLMKNAARVYDISFWQSTADASLHRTGRKTHYPDHLVGAFDPYILLAHQGMLEELFIDDMESRGVFVTRNSRFVSCSRRAATRQLEIAFEDMITNTMKTLRAEHLVGCDGARSKVRAFIPDAELEGNLTNESGGVLDGIFDTSFPDLWSKVAVRSYNAGSILWIPRERNMTRLYVELSSAGSETVDKAKATPEYVMQRARDAMQPYRLEWRSVEWFGNYVVGQRVARHFMDPDGRVFIAGDLCSAAHCHSALAAQGANTGMHDSFNLAWKLNLVIRGLAKPSLLSTYEEERRKIANDLINFDAEHCRAFSPGEAALAKHFDDNIRFIFGMGAEYPPGLLSRGRHAILTRLRPGALQLPARVTRYVDANPVDIQLDIPLLSQFRIYLFILDIHSSLAFLSTLCERLTISFLRYKTSYRANQSYASQPLRLAPMDEFIQPQRYTTPSSILTLAMLTQTSKSDFEIADLPPLLQESRWTLYLDDIDTPRCTEKWVGIGGIGSLERDQVGITIVRPDGYGGSIELWDVNEPEQAVRSVEDYFEFMR